MRCVLVVKNCAFERTICCVISFVQNLRGYGRASHNTSWLYHKIADSQWPVYSYVILWDINWEKFTHWKESRAENICNRYSVSNTGETPQVTVENGLISTLKKEAICFSETVLSTYQTGRHHNPEDYSPNLQGRMNWKPENGNCLSLRCYTQKHYTSRPQLGPQTASY